MKREGETNRIAGIIRGRDKLYEYSPAGRVLLPLPLEFTPSKLFPLAIGFLGDFAAEKVSMFIGDDPGTETREDDVAFSAKILLSYSNARIDPTIREELALLSASAFHLIEMPGVSWVQANRLQASHTQATYLERVLIWLLIKPWAQDPPLQQGYLEVFQLVRTLRRHYLSGTTRSELVGYARDLRNKSYGSYDDRELLLADLITSVVICRYENSSRRLLHEYAKTGPDAWTSYLRADSALHELWPSQRKLGRAGVLAGSSAVVQMPTSAGKTKATEIILRTAFTSGRARLAVVVAPFVALCDEIHDALRSALAIDRVQVNRIGDALQVDYVNTLWEEEESDSTFHVVVITPEKLLYVLRQRPEVASQIDLVIYDEGHQFDAGARGVTYELLLTSIKRRIGRYAQTVLISAVIENAGVVSKWLLGSEDDVVVDTSNQTQRSIGFASKQSDGQIYFISNSDSEPAFAVPGIMIAERLRTTPREDDRFFPNHTDSKSVSLYLGLRLVVNGGVAIFCGKKDSASALLRYALDVYDRDTSLEPPSAFCDALELSRFIGLYEENFGDKSYLTVGARLGVFTHTGSTPRGLRTAIEHAMRERRIMFVICTSTLAQGVNLPIKYLLVSGIQQGKEPIRARDFKNLMGRAGRAGMHEEGAVIFCDTKLYDERAGLGAKKWQEANRLIRADDSDPVGSSLLHLVLPFKDKFGGRVAGLPPVDIALYLLDEADGIDALVQDIKGGLSKYKLEEADFRAQLAERLELMKRLQSHVLASASDIASPASPTPSDLAVETLAYHIATNGQRADLVRLFVGVARSVGEEVPEPERQVRYGKSLLGVLVSRRIDEWVEEHFDELVECADAISMGRILWPLLLSAVVPHRLHCCEPPEALEELFRSWLSGDPYSRLLDEMTGHQASYPWGATKRRKYDIDDVVDLCENLFGFEIPLVLAGVKASVVAYGGDNRETRRFSFRLDALQKRVKYGLPNENSVTIFEAGFSDRVVSQRVEQAVWGKLNNREALGVAIRDWQVDVEDALDEFPSYFRSVFLALLVESEG